MFRGSKADAIGLSGEKTLVPMVVIDLKWQWHCYQSVPFGIRAGGSTWKIFRFYFTASSTHRGK